jgi:hypothetical protein
VLLVPEPFKVSPLSSRRMEVQRDSPGGTTTVSPFLAPLMAAATSDSEALAAFLIAARPSNAKFKTSPAATIVATLLKRNAVTMRSTRTLKPRRQKPPPASINLEEAPADLSARPEAFDH